MRPVGAKCAPRSVFAMRAGSPETPCTGDSPVSRIHMTRGKAVFDRAIELSLSAWPRLVSIFL
jgi:hypothetical protein